MDYAVLLRVTSITRIAPIYLDYPGLHRFFPDYFELLRIASNYLGLPVWITKCSSRLPEYTVDYAGLLRVTCITRIAPIYLDYHGLLRFTSNYCGFLRITPDYQFGSPSVSADYRSTLWITPDYSGLLALSGLLRFTWITPDCSDFFRIAPDYFGVLRIRPD